MRKILQVVSTLQRNGTETAIMNIYRNIDRSKYQFDFLVFSSEDMAYFPEIESLGGNVFVVYSRRYGICQYWKGIKHFFKENALNYDTVHFNFCYISTICPFYYAWKYKIPQRICHAHSSYYTGGTYNKYLHWGLRKIAVALSTDYLACSRLAKDWFYKNTKGEKEAVILPNGIDLKLFVFNPTVRSEYRKMLNYKDEFVIGHVGYFTEVKNHKFIIDVFEEVVKMLPSARLLLIGGGGDLEDFIQSYVVERGLVDKVRFLGKRTDVSSLLQAIDYFIFPSLFEGLPLSLIEAQMSSLKVVCSDTISLEAKITDNIDFLSLEKGQRVWASHILSQIPYKREKLLSVLHNSRFNIRNSVKILEKLYATKTN